MRGYVYLIGTQRFGWYKIGRAKHPEVRIRDLGILLPFKIKVFAVWKSDDCEKLESELHWKYSVYNINGEWFSFHPLKIREIIFTDLYHLQRVFVDDQDKTSDLARFSNMKRDRYKIGHDHPTLSPVECEQRRLMSTLKKKAVLEWLSINDLPDTPENRRLARTAISDISSSLEASSERLQPGLILKG